MMNLPVLIMLFVCIVVPLGLAGWIWRLEEQTRGGWLVMIAYALNIVVFILLVGRWDIAGYYTRFVLLAPLVAAILISWRRHADRPWRASDDTALWRSHWSTLLPLFLFLAAIIYIADGFFPKNDARPLRLPLEGGDFMVVQGGGNLLLNYHHTHSAQQYAVDIVAINGAGFRATGIYPDDPTRYVAYGAAVISPCAGEVTAVRKGLPDLRPPESDPRHPAGNHIIIACDGMLVELAHLQKGSIDVEVGDRLMAGERIARIGNSGNTSEPHLHIHAVDARGDGEGIAISFGGMFPVRNSLFVR